jgi:hypothetical protein
MADISPLCRRMIEAPGSSWENGHRSASEGTFRLRLNCIPTIHFHHAASQHKFPHEPSHRT